MPERGHHHDGAVEDWRICLLSVGPSSFGLFVLPGIDEGCLNKKIPALFYRGQEFFYWGDEPADSMMEKIFRPILRTLPSSFLGKEPNHVVTFPRAVISTEVEKSPFSIASRIGTGDLSTQSLNRARYLCPHIDMQLRSRWQFAEQSTIILIIIRIYKYCVRRTLNKRFTFFHSSLFYLLSIVSDFHFPLPCIGPFSVNIFPAISFSTKKGCPSAVFF